MWPFTPRKRQSLWTPGQPDFGVSRWKNWIVFQLGYHRLLQTMEIAKVALAIVKTSREADRVFVRYNSPEDPDTMIWSILIMGSVNEGKQTYVLTTEHVAEGYRYIVQDHVLTREGYKALPRQDLANRLFILTRESDACIELPPSDLAMEPLHWESEQPSH